jgi:hypothetical protein
MLEAAARTRPAACRRVRWLALTILFGLGCSVHEHALSDAQINGDVDAHDPSDGATQLMVTCGNFLGGCICSSIMEFTGLDTCSADSVVAGSPGDIGFCCAYGAAGSTCQCSILGCRDDPTGACACQPQDGSNGASTGETECSGIGQTCCLPDSNSSCHCSDAPCEGGEHQVAHCGISDIMKCPPLFAPVSKCL